VPVQSNMYNLVGLCKMMSQSVIEKQTILLYLHFHEILNLYSHFTKISFIYFTTAKTPSAKLCIEKLLISTLKNITSLVLIDNLCNLFNFSH